MFVDAAMIGALRHDLQDGRALSMPATIEAHLVTEEELDNALKLYGNDPNEAMYRIVKEFLEYQYGHKRAPEWLVVR
jgi:hypothetical protein